MSEPPAAALSPSSRHAISVLIVTAAVLWNLVAIARAVALNHPGPIWIPAEIGFWMGLAHAQVILIAGFVAWGRWNVAIRTVILLLGIVASSALLAEVVGFHVRLHLTIFLYIVLGIVVPLGGLRVLGFGLVHRDSPPPHRRPWQITLWQYLSLITAAAMMLMLARWTVVPEDGLRGFVDWLVPQSAIGLICLVVPLAFKRWWCSACVTGAASIVLGLWYLDLADSYRFLMLAMTQWFVVVGCCGVIRLAGYRLTWRSSITLDQPTSSAPPHTTAHPGT